MIINLFLFFATQCCLIGAQTCNTRTAHVLACYAYDNKKRSFNSQDDGIQRARSDIQEIDSSFGLPPRTILDFTVEN